MKYTGESSTETALIKTAKLLINSTLLTKGGKFMAINILNIYIQNNLEDYQYIHFAMNMIPQDIIDAYNLKAIIHKDSYCYAEIIKTVYNRQTEKSTGIKRLHTVKIHTRIIHTQDKRHCILTHC